jgi:hypothetical protein
MKMKLIRDVFTATFTLGVLYLDYEQGAGWQHFGFTVEDRDRGLDKDMDLSEIKRRKVPKITCIPAGGPYQIVLEYSGKFGRDTPTVARVPGYRYIRFHAGTRATHTDGCIPPGLSRNVAKGTLGKSPEATQWLRDRIQQEIRAGKDVALWIERDPVAWSAFQALGLP